MANGIRTGDPRGFNKGRRSKFREGSRVRQTTEEGRRTYQPKHCGNNNEDENNSPKNLNDKNQQASSQKFRQLMLLFYPFAKCVQLEGFSSYLSKSKSVFLLMFWIVKSEWRDLFSGEVYGSISMIGSWFFLVIRICCFKYIFHVFTL